MSTINGVGVAGATRCSLASPLSLHMRSLNTPTSSYIPPMTFCRNKIGSSILKISIFRIWDNPVLLPQHHSFVQLSIYHSCTHLSLFDTLQPSLLSGQSSSFKTTKDAVKKNVRWDYVSVFQPRTPHDFLET